MLIFISILLGLLGKDLLDDRGNSFICKEVFEKLFLFLRFKLAYINAVNVRYLYLIRLYLDALDVFQLCQCPPLSHVLLHLIYVFNKHLIQLTLLTHLLLHIHILNPIVDPLTLFNLYPQLFLELSLHVRLPYRVESEVLLDLTRELFLSRAHLPHGLHEVRELRVTRLQSLLFFCLEFGSGEVLTFLLSLKLVSLVWV